MQQQDAWIRAIVEKSWDSIWTAETRSERIKLLKDACLAAAVDESVRSEVEQLGDDFWNSLLGAIEVEIAIIVQALAETERE
jgi:hypothetical protein